MLKNLNALVTGSSKGLGKSIALMLAEEGANIAIHYASDKKGAEDTLEKAAAFGAKTCLLQADIGNSNEISKLIENAIAFFGKIDILVNNAGIFIDKNFFEITEEIFDRTIDVNLKGSFLMMQGVAKHMIEKQIKGRIVNISSALSITGCEHQPHYAASKAGVNMLTKAGAYELAQYGITVNAIMPGTIETNANKGQLSEPGTAAQILSRTPMKSFGKPKHIAEAVKYFVSQNAEWTTGSIISIDGGYLA